MINPLDVWQRTYMCQWW